MRARILKLLGLCGLVACCVSAMLMSPSTASAQGYCVNGQCFSTPPPQYASGVGMNSWRVGLDYGVTLGIGGSYGQSNGGGYRAAPRYSPPVYSAPPVYSDPFYSPPAETYTTVYESPPVVTSYSENYPVTSTVVYESPPVVTSVAAYRVAPPRAAYAYRAAVSRRAAAAYRWGYRAAVVRGSCPCGPNCTCGPNCPCLSR